MDNVSLLASFLKMIFALAIVLGLLIGVMYFIKKFMNSSGAATDDQALINIISSRYLGPKSSIILVEVMDEVIVVGISGQHMTPLSRIDDPLTIAKMKAKQTSASVHPLAGKSIAKYLNWASLPGNKKTEKPGK